MASRLYMGRLPPGVAREDIEDHFKGFKLNDVRLMGTFAFLEFGSSRDADDAVRDFAGRSFKGEDIILEHPRETRRRDIYDGRGPPGGDRGFAPRPERRRGVRVNVIGIPQATSWQDLKDYGRIGNNNVVFADVDRNNPGQGIIEFGSLTEAEEALTRLAGVDINNTPVKLEIVPDDGSVPVYRAGPLGRERDDRPRYDDRGPPRDYGRPRYDDRRDDRGRQDDRYVPRDRGDRGDRDDRRDRDRDDRGGRGDRGDRGDRGGRERGDNRGDDQGDRERDREREARREKDYGGRERSPVRRGEDDRYVDSKS
ncbi:uncharacterized protein MKK02DRAFT_44887 [Dioszegia hungarica]|uniref:RRM domain-containing protein n=1 Tax=Dioszegia hungarica TaxID=4972 RepID=A0AA38HB12_9TREE|nr:uncharacterized protein MKK02DRAFT_44887 [Dioszegia hungarica]KAI9636184.1 hypothetical protein MKK02DRAFT_44887 [Dioszegia hungarica]